MNYPRRSAAGYQKEIINRPKGRGINPLSASGRLKKECRIMINDVIFLK